MMATRSPFATPSALQAERGAADQRGVVAPGALAVDAEVLGAEGDGGGLGPRVADEELEGVGAGQIGRVHEVTVCVSGARAPGKGIVRASGEAPFLLRAGTV